MTDFVKFFMFIIVIISCIFLELIDYLDRKESEKLMEDPMVQHLIWRDYEEEVKKRRENKYD